MAKPICTPTHIKKQEYLQPLFDKDQIQIDKKQRVIFIKDLPTKADKSGHKRRYCIVKCPFCFKEFEILKQNAKKVKSCGCMTKQLQEQSNYKHGLWKSRLYQCWADMKTRCHCENNSNYHRYGGRGISVCEEWNNFECFKTWAETNGYKNNLTIDRIDNDGNYSPDNCRWVTLHENLKNKSRQSYCTNQKIYKTDILEIYKMFKNGITKQDIALKFKVKKSTITAIINKTGIYKNIDINLEDII